LIQTVADALAKQGYETLTPVQEAVSDETLVGSDLLVSAQTGSGKTVAFGLAIAPTLLEDAERFGPAAAPLALVIAPTRELAMQVSRELSWLYGQTGAVVTTCVGGMDTRTERRALDRGAHIVVATPGRLCDHIKRNNIDLGAIRAVVLDEADEMLDLGFREDLEFILGEAPEDRRTLMFSATVPAAIAKLAKSYQRDAQRINTVGEAKQHTDIEYRALTVNPRDTENAIINVLRFYEAKNAIVFCNTRAAVARLTTRFTNRGFSVVALSGELTQSERTNALQALRDGRARVCIATDVAARGIDLPNLELVIHADLPSNADTLKHRSGRTGRAGRKGVSALIVPPKMKSKANRLLGWANLTATWAAPPSAADVNAADEERLLADEAWSIPAPEDAMDFVTTLTEKYTKQQLATAFVNLYRARASAPEELGTASGADDKPRAAFGPSVWFSVSKGRNDGAEPRTLLPMLCRLGDITKDDIGAIRVQDSHAFIEILESSSAGFMAALGPDMKGEDGAVITKLDKAPDLPRGGSKRGPKPEWKSGGGAGHGGGKKFDKDGPRKPRKAYDSDRPSEPRKPKPARAEPSRVEYAPRDEAPRKPKGERPPKSHKTDRSPMKPGAKPKAKAVWKSEKPTGTATTPRGDKPWADKPRGDRPSGGKPKGGKPAGGKSKFAGKPKGNKTTPRAESGGENTYKRASDPSKRFTPPHKRGAQGGDARPKRK